MATVIKATSLLQRQARWAWLASLGSLATAMLSILLVWQWRPKELWVYAVPFLLLNAAGVVGNWCLIYIRGYLGERRVFGALRKLPDEYALLNDVNLSVGVKQAQIDHVVVSPYGVWCVETKSHRGVIHGRENDRNWTQVKQSERGKRYRKQFYNPVSQNAVHCRRLADYLKGWGISAPVHSVVVFTGAKLQVETSTPVVGTRELPDVIRQGGRERCLDDTQMAQVVGALLLPPPSREGRAETEAQAGEDQEA